MFGNLFGNTIEEAVTRQLGLNGDWRVVAERTNCVTGKRMVGLVSTEETYFPCYAIISEEVYGPPKVESGNFPSDFIDRDDGEREWKRQDKECWFDRHFPKWRALSR
jgi:hypothetical protein